MSEIEGSESGVVFDKLADINRRLETGSSDALFDQLAAADGCPR